MDNNAIMCHLVYKNVLRTWRFPFAVLEADPVRAETSAGAFGVAFLAQGAEEVRDIGGPAEVAEGLPDGAEVAGREVRDGVEFAPVESSIASASSTTIRLRSGSSRPSATRSAEKRTATELFRPSLSRPGSCSMK